MDEAMWRAEAVSALMQARQHVNHAIFAVGQINSNSATEAIEKLAAAIGDAVLLLLQEK